MFIKMFSIEAQNLLMALLNFDPVFRPTAEEALKHKWFNNDKEALSNSLFINNLLCTNA